MVSAKYTKQAECNLEDFYLKEVFCWQGFEQVSKHVLTLCCDGRSCKKRWIVNGQSLELINVPRVFVSETSSGIKKTLNLSRKLAKNGSRAKSIICQILLHKHKDSGTCGTCVHNVNKYHHKKIYSPPCMPQIKLCS